MFAEGHHLQHRQMLPRTEYCPEHWQLLWKKCRQLAHALWLFHARLLREPDRHRAFPAGHRHTVSDCPSHSDMLFVLLGIHRVWMHSPGIAGNKAHPNHREVGSAHLSCQVHWGCAYCIRQSNQLCRWTWTHREWPCYPTFPEFRIGFQLDMHLFPCEAWK